MSPRTAATALLLASLPYGLALPQVIPLVSDLAPNVTPGALSLIPTLDASTVTVVGTIVQPAVESAVEEIADAIEDATETVASALKSATDAVEGGLPTDAPSILDLDSNILPLILPGVLPVETDLPPVGAPDVVSSDLTDTDDLEVIDLPAPSEDPYSDDGLIAEPFFPDFLDLPDEANVPISTFNAVVQPLLSVIQTLLNSLPGNFAPPLPGIFPHPLLPNETPEIFIDPPLPTEAFNDADGTATDTFDPLISIVIDPIPTNSIAADLPFAKRQAATDIDTNSIYALIAPILEAINALLAQIPSVGHAVSDVVSNVQAGVPELPVDVPTLPIVDVPSLPVPDTTLPILQLPPVNVPDALPTDDFPVDVPTLALPELPLTTPPALPGLTSDIPDEVLNAPFPDDIEGIDWAAFESPPFSGLPATSLDDVAIPDDILNVPVPDFDENGLPIDNVLDTISDATAAAPLVLPTSLDAPGVLPTNLLDWPFADIPETIAPAVDGELPDLDDLPIPDDVLNVPVLDGAPLDLPTDAAGGLLADPLANLPVPTNFLEPAVPTELLDVPVPTDLLNVPVPTDLLNVPVPTNLLDVPVPTDLLDVPVPTDLFDIPVPEGFEDIAVPTEIVTALPAAPSLADLADASIPDDILSIPWPELDENGVPIDLPVDSGNDLIAPAPPTNLNWWDIPVPDDWVDVDDVPSILPAPVTPDNILAPEILDESSLPLDLPAPALPIEAFGAGFPIQALPDVPLALPAASDVASELPVDNLLPIEGPAALTEAFTDVPTDALSGLPTSILADVLPVPADALAVAPAVTGLAEDLPVLPAPADVLAPALPIAAPAVADPALSLVPAVKLPFQVPAATGSLGRRQLPDLFAQTTLPVDSAQAASPAAVNAITMSLIKPLLSLVSSLLAKLPGVGQTVPDLGATLPDVSTLVPALPLPAIGGVASTVTGALPASLLPRLEDKLKKRQFGLFGGLPFLGGFTGGLPNVGGLAGGLTQNLPLVGGLTGGLTGGLPNIGGLTQNLPLVGGLTGGLTSGLPNVGGLTQNLPLVGGLTGGLTSGLPNVGGLTQNLPLVGGLTGGLTGGLPNADGLASTVTGVVSTVPLVGGLVGGAAPALGSGAIPDVGGLTPTATKAVKAVPGLGDVASTAVPKVPLAFDSGLTKTLIPASLPLDPSVLLGAIKPVLSIIESIVASLPTAGVPHAKRDAAALPIDPELIFKIIAPLLQVVNKLIELIPADKPELPAVTNIINGLQKRGVTTDIPSLPVPLDINIILAVIRPLLELATGLLTKIPAPVSSVISTSPLNNVLGSLPLGKRDTAAIPGLEILASILEPLLALVNSLLAKSPIPLSLSVPDVGLDSIVGSLTKRQLETITGALDPASTLSLVQSLVQTILGLLNALPVNPATVLPKIPLSGFGKRDLDSLPLQPDQILGLVKPILSLITSLLKTLVPTVSDAVSSLPVPIRRQVLGTGIDPAAIAATVAPLQSLSDASAILEILPPLLRVLGQLIAGLPLPAVQQIPLVNTLGNLGKRQLRGASADATQALSILPGLLNLLSGLLGSLNLPVNAGSIVTGAAAPVLGAATVAAGPVLNVAAPLAAPALGIAAPILGVATGAVAPVVGTVGGLTGTVGSLTGTVGGLAGGAGGLTNPLGSVTRALGGLTGGLTKTLPIPVNLPLARRAIEKFQQGPASDWESFLGELDESKQPELAGLIHDSAKAVNNDNLDTLADTLRSDFGDLSEYTKSALLEGFAATTFGKRSLRLAKRQEFFGVPGVQSIGPNLDDAQKIDLSGFNLDPNNQLNGLAAGGTPVDTDRPPTPGSFEQLSDPSISLGDPELLDILVSGGLDPNGMRSPVGGAPVDDVEETDPYEGIRQSLEPAFGSGKPLEGLDATLQAAKNNRFSERKPSLSWVPQAGGSAAAQQAVAAAKQQGNVMLWFQKSIKPSWNKDVDAEIMR
ncbi:uncharacterized protein M421DRAFT_89677 [Didymella exigua CBS 183.55]|uniref:Uncharacterized protein n=1 Tax=Didymella exigua CBS 183.55 TaxID=1150837 RepID=A0A6A5S4E3_9PLEO|nr:uncharacterized protein M421DRAFT_89677 [Didymella exigua CBS 183.55]KAF1932377.1 hypothetical protein M421DRAFT_89677 [Didymella exigua CBS 183.55]